MRFSVSILTWCSLVSAVASSDSEVGDETVSMLQHAELPMPRSSSVGLIVLADEKFRQKYRTHLMSLECYTKRHGYDLHVFGLNQEQPVACQRFKNPFFKKHCVAAEFLQAQRVGYTALVLDADIATVNLDRGLDKWLANDADIQFYIRDGNREVTAGVYLAKKSEFTQKFLMRWARYEGRTPIGYSSFDNGALHLMLLHATRAEGGNICAHMYENLTELNQGGVVSSSYWRFVDCALDALGTPRTWRVTSEDGAGAIAVWPSLNFAVSDGPYASKKVNVNQGPVFHHGTKDEQEMLCAYWSDLSKCELNPHRVEPDVAWWDRFALNGGGPRCEQCTTTCLKNFDCEPLGPSEGDAMARQAHADVPFIEPKVTHAHIFSTTTPDHLGPWRWQADRINLDTMFVELFPEQSGGVSAARCGSPA